MGGIHPEGEEARSEGSNKSFRLNRWRSINGEGDLSSTRIRSPKQIRPSNNHPQTKGFDP